MQTWHESRRSHRPLFILGDFNSPVSYNFLARMLTEAMRCSNMNVAIDSRCILGQLCPSWMRQMEAQSTPADWKIWIYPVSQLWDKGVDKAHPLVVDKRTILYTMWEAPNLRKEWVETLNRAALVIVPCRWNEFTFLANGVTAPVTTVPLGCNTKVYRPYFEEARQIREFAEVHGQQEGCTFGTAGALTGGGWRKNHLAVARAFQQAFPTEPDVRLQIKVTPYCVRHPFKDLDGQTRWTDGLLNLDDAHLVDDRIEVIDTFMEDAQQADWYRGLDALVNASSGEGFGLHLLEGMACGTPLISMEWSGETEFFSERVGWPLRCGDGFKLGEVPPFRAPYHGCWAEPDVGVIARHMRRVYENREEARAKGAEAAKVAARFTWTEVGERLRVKLGKFMAGA